MSRFCVAQLTPDTRLQATHGLLRGAELGASMDGAAVAAQRVRQAEEHSAAILSAARAQAQQLTQESMHAAQAAVLSESAQLLQGLRAAQDALCNDAADIVTGLARALFERLVQETTPQERLAASYRRVLQEAPPRLVNAVLRLHPDDLLSVGAGWEWTLKADPELARGACRLEADSGEWHADFAAAAGALAGALSGLAGPGMAPGEPGPGAGHSS